MTAILVYTKEGIKIGEFSQNMVCEWATNDTAGMEFELSVPAEIERLGTSKFIEMIGYDKLFFVDFENELEDWVGIVVGRKWGTDSILKLELKSAEYLLGFEVNDKEKVLKGTTGAAFQQILAMYNKLASIKIGLGDIYTGSKIKEDKLAVTDMLTEAKRIAKATKSKFTITPKVENNRLILQGNWFLDAPVTTDFRLIEGHNFLLPGGDILSESTSKLVTHVIGMGSGITSESRPSLTLEDTDASAQYLHRADIKSYYQAENKGQLTEYVQDELNNSKASVAKLKLLVLNVENAWQIMKRGNIVKLESYTFGVNNGGVGLSTQCVIKTMRYTKKSEYLEAVVELI
jgi:hypothetical protein